MKVLIIEDDPGVVEAISLAFELRWPDVAVVSASQGEKGVELAGAESPDIVILDIGLPDISGFEVLRQIRRFSDVPVIIVTVKIEETDKVKGLELGADDYITKPFSHLELLGRVKAVLRRTHMPEIRTDQKPFTCGKLVIDFAQRAVFLGDTPIRLTPIEYNLLHLLIRNQGRVISHRTLLEKVWGEEYIEATDYLKVYIQRLREKIEDEPRKPRMLLSERGIGYKFQSPSY
jgi:DNA-binding response OmpR family regulator